MAPGWAEQRLSAPGDGNAEIGSGTERQLCRWCDPGRALLRPRRSGGRPLRRGLVGGLRGPGPSRSDD